MTKEVNFHFVFVRVDEINIISFLFWRKSSLFGQVDQLIKLEPPNWEFLKDNEVMANPGKFKLMILSKTNVNYSIKLLNKWIYSFRVTKPSTHHDESLTLKSYFTSIFRVSNSMRKNFNIALELVTRDF